ncbi:hypothetical protein [Shewanella algae]|uniref:hypothetical protein n=1 Tax=Shewanella algae TaxID=38313 RepID=UPI0031F4AE93
MAIDLIAQTGLSSLPVIYYLEQLFSQGCVKHQKDMAVLYLRAKHQKDMAVLYFFSIYQLATGGGHNQPRLSFDEYFKA